MKKGRIFLFLIPLLLIAAGSSYYFYARNIVNQWEDRIYPHTYVRGIDLSGKTREEAKILLENDTKPIYNKKINVKASSNFYTLDYSTLNPSFNIHETIDYVYSLGKDGNIFNKLSAIKNPRNSNLDLKFSFEDVKVNEFINRIEKDVIKSPVNAAIKMTSPGNFLVSRDESGVVFDKEALRSEIISNIKGTENDKNQFVAKLEEAKPLITYDMLKGVNSLVSTYSTFYNPKNFGRSHNIELAAKKIKGTLLLPGDTFSFNERAGKRTVSNGFKTAPVIVNNKLEDGIGGGVCQVSTTLYNAVIRCNIISLSRKNHSLVPAYVKPGLDATVSDYIDYKFKNTLDYPIYIDGNASNGKITFDIYSNYSLNKIKYELVSEVYEMNHAKLNYKNDPSIPVGTIEEDSAPHTGYKVRVYLVGKSNNKTISNVLISKDIYRKVDGLVRIGTKKLSQDYS